MTCAGGGVEERNVCLCLVFVSLSQQPLTRSHATLKTPPTSYYHLQSPFAHMGNLVWYKVVKYGAMQVGSHGKVEKYVVPIESAECPDKEAQSVVKPPQWTEAQCTVE